MRLPKDPPQEPSSAIIMPNLYCPADPDTPYNLDLEPREEETHFAPLEPLLLREPIEPEAPGYPERMIKMSIEEFKSDKVDEDEQTRKADEPQHDDEPVLEYPCQERPLVLPPETPSKFEPPSAPYLDEPEPDMGEVEDAPT